MIGLITGVTGSCLFYTPFHFSTARPSRPWVMVTRIDEAGVRAELRRGAVRLVDRRGSSRKGGPGRGAPPGDGPGMTRVHRPAERVIQRRLAA